MQISHELTEKDFTEAYSVHRNRNALSKWSRRILLSTAGLFVAIIVFGNLVKPSAQGIKTLIPFLGVVTLWVVCLWILPRRNMRRQYTKQPGAQGPRQLTLDAFGAHWRWNGGSADVEWKNYIRSIEGANQILFYTSPACFNILPKRALNPDQLSELRALLAQNISPPSAR